jgi:hypothetical protein
MTDDQSVSSGNSTGTDQKENTTSLLPGNSLGTDQKENTTSLLSLPSNGLRTDPKKSPQLHPFAIRVVLSNILPLSWGLSERK